MKKALISPNEEVSAPNGTVGARVAQVEVTSFEVAQPLFWADCPDDCVSDQWYYVGGQCIAIPPAPVPVPTAEQNAATAQAKIDATNWAVEADAADPAYPPYLMNQQAFLDYRSQLRQYVAIPVEGDINWPTEPVAQWGE
jgi:hypothetical protein